MPRSRSSSPLRRRSARERRARQSGGNSAEILAAQSERDARDEGREHGALRAADDAVELDTTGMSQDEVIAEVVRLARTRGLA